MAIAVTHYVTTVTLYFLDLATFFVIVNVYVTVVVNVTVGIIANVTMILFLGCGCCYCALAGIFGSLVRGGEGGFHNA